MAFDRLRRARNALRSYQQTGLAGYGHLKRVVFALSLCIFILVSAGCAQDATTLAGQTSATTPHQKSVKQITYVAIGASDTFGLGTNDPYDDNWPTDLASLLGASHIHLINL